MLLLTRDFDSGRSVETMSPVEYAYPSTTYPLRPSNRFGRLQESDHELWDAVIKRLSTQRGAYRAYDDTYGVDWINILAHDRDWVVSWIGRELTEALGYDDRVKSVRVENIRYKIDSMRFTLTINDKISGEITYG